MLKKIIYIVFASALSASAAQAFPDTCDLVVEENNVVNIELISRNQIVTVCSAYKFGMYQYTSGVKAKYVTGVENHLAIIRFDRNIDFYHNTDIVFHGSYGKKMFVSKIRLTKKE